MVRFNLGTVVPYTLDRSVVDVAGVWPELVMGAPDDPPYALTIGHRLEPAGFVFVQTSDAALLEAKFRDVARVPAEVAMDALVLHVNITLPPSEMIPAGLIPRAMERASEASERLADWTVVDVSVEGAVRPARLWSFAGGWTLVIDRPVDGVWLAAVGVDVSPEGIGLVALSSVGDVGAENGAFDVTRMTELRREVLGDEDIRAPALHADYRALLTA